MAFQVESGNGDSGANSYLSTADADTYWGDRVNATSPGGNAWTDASTTEKEGALVEASQYLDANFEWVWNNPPLWRGHINPLSPLEAYTPLKDKDQGLQWPRNAAYDEETYVLQDGVPDKVKDATAEMALILLDGAVNAPLERGGRIKREAVGSLSVEYMDSAPGDTSYPKVNRLLTGLYWNRGGTRKLRRA